MPDGTAVTQVPPAARPAQPQSEGIYVVLRREPSDDGGGPERWSRIADQPAHSADAACRKVFERDAEKLDDNDRQFFVAVPKRSWQPKPLTFKTKRHVVTE